MKSLQEEDQSNEKSARIYSSKYRGVYYNSKSHSWIAQFKKHKKATYIGSFDDEEQAAKAYDQHSYEHGNTILNFPSLLCHDFSLSSSSSITLSSEEENDYENVEEKEEEIMRMMGKSKQGRKRHRKSSSSSSHKPHRVSSSDYKGVCWNTKQEKWRAQIQYQGEQFYIGTYHTEIEAARAYNEVAKKFYGDEARLNEIPSLDEDNNDDEDNEKMAYLKELEWVEKETQSLLTYCCPTTS